MHLSSSSSSLLEAIALPGDPPMSPALLAQHKMPPEEYATLCQGLGRTPTYTELGVVSAMWSEHCSYKSSRVHLRRLPTRGSRVLQGPGENAGVVDLGHGMAAVFKIESHNHPSFLEPYQGAATGVGGILRDIFTMGARPIAMLNALRFGALEHPRTPELLRGVVAGIGGYGNAIGVPTLGSNVQFDPSYNGNILVNAFACGVVPTDRIFYGRAAGVGNLLVYVGTKTGRDGIHGAVMASDTFSEGGPSQRPTVQVGDPFLGKLLLEACLELFASGFVLGVQDMGAAGLTSSSVEMGSRAHTGIELHLDRIPRRAARMTPYELLLSESQERMLFVVEPHHAEALCALCAKWELDAEVIGRVTDTGRWVALATPGYDPLAQVPPAGEPEVVCSLPLQLLTEEAPAYARPVASVVPRSPQAEDPSWRSPGADPAVALCAQGSDPNFGARSWIEEQYDHTVRGNTLLGPGSKAGVVRVEGPGGDTTREIFLAFSLEGDGQRCGQDPYEGGARAVVEACRNLVCVGAEPIGLTDGLNFGNPERPEVMAQLSLVIDGIAAAATALQVPIVSGNVSLYNETDGQAILPTPVIGAVGQLRSADDLVTPWFKNPGDGIILLAAPPGASLAETLAGEVKLQGLVLHLARSHRLRSAASVSQGGLAATLAHGSTSSPDPTDDRAWHLRPHEAHMHTSAWLWEEIPGRVLITVTPEDCAEVVSQANAAHLTATPLGTVLSGEEPCQGFDAPQITSTVTAQQLRDARHLCLDIIVKR